MCGAVAAAVWALQQPIDKRVFDCAYDDVELLGKAVTRGDGWYPIGLRLAHGSTGPRSAPATPTSPRRCRYPAATRGPAVALAEHVGLWPLGAVTDRLHPARRELPKLQGNRDRLRAGAWRHLLFGVVLGELERRVNAQPETAPPEPEATYSSNGHGSLEHALTVSEAERRRERLTLIPAEARASRLAGPDHRRLRAGRQLSGAGLRGRRATRSGASSRRPAAGFGAGLDGVRWRSVDLRDAGRGRRADRGGGARGRLPPGRAVLGRALVAGAGRDGVGERRGRGRICWRRCARRRPSARVVWVSSCEVYGAPDALPITEAARTAPESPYAVSKLAAEQLAGVYRESFGLRVVRGAAVQPRRARAAGRLPALLAGPAGGRSAARRAARTSAS